MWVVAKSLKFYFLRSQDRAGGSGGRGQSALAILSQFTKFTKFTQTKNEIQKWRNKNPPQFQIKNAPGFDGRQFQNWTSKSFLNFLLNKKNLIEFN